MAQSITIQELELMRTTIERKIQEVNTNIDYVLGLINSGMLQRAQREYLEERHQVLIRSKRDWESDLRRIHIKMDEFTLAGLLEMNKTHSHAA